MGSVNTTGYGQMTTRRDGEKRRPRLVHRLSYEYAYGPITSEQIVCHKCDNPSCVRPDHLFVGTQLDNMRDMYRKGRGLSGRNAKPRLSPAQVLAIRNSTDPRKVIAKKHAIHVQTVSMIRLEQTWKNL